MLPIIINIIPRLTNCSQMIFCSELLLRTKLPAKQKYAHFIFTSAEVTIIIHIITNSIKSEYLEYF